MNQKLLTFKRSTRIVSLILLFLTIGIFTSCKNKEEDSTHLNSEEDALKIAIQGDNYTINPFYHQTKADEQACELLFSKLITHDANGDVAYGENYNTIFDSYQVYYLDSKGNKQEEYTNGAEIVYEFTMKKGMKFSDDVAITMDDVLFSLYTYLDPAYSGDDVIYTLPIKGLYEYRNQISKEKYELYQSITETIQTAYFANGGKYSANLKVYSEAEWKMYDELVQNTILELFNNAFSFEAKTTELQKVEQAFSFLASKGFGKNGGFVLDESNLYIYQNGYKYKAKSDNNGKYVLIDQSGVLKLVLYNDLTEEEKTTNQNAKRYSVGTIEEAKVFYPSFGDFIDYSGWNKENDYLKVLDVFVSCFKKDNTDIQYDDLCVLLGGENYLITNEIFNEFIQKLNKANGGEKIQNISGIEVVQEDVLKMTFTKIDTSIIDRLMVYLAPKHYYTAGYDYEGDIINYGVEFNSQKFMKYMNSYNKAPVGSGPYKMRFDCDFMIGKDLYFERNNNFTTMGGSNITNAKIKYVTLVNVKVGDEYNALTRGDVYYSEVPFSNAMASKITLNYAIIVSRNLGYGAIYFNPALLENMNERIALMSVLNPSLVESYYSETVAERIYRSMSNVMAAYPKNMTDSYPYDNTLATAIAAFQAMGYVYNEETKLFENGPSYTFYISSSEENSPFGDIFRNAQVLLESIGISTKIVSSTSLSDNINKSEFAIYGIDYTSDYTNDLYYQYYSNGISDTMKAKGMDSLSSVESDGTITVTIASTTLTLTQKDASIYLNNIIDSIYLEENDTKQRELYKDALEIISKLAIELPIYQKKNLYVYDYTIIDEDTVNSVVSFCYSPLQEIWKINYTK